MYSIRNVEDGQTIALTGGGGTNDGGSQEFCVGLTLDESLVCSLRRENRTAGTSDPSCSSSVDNLSIVVPLVMVTVWKTSGVTVCPASRDLRCRLNGEDLDKESNLIPGSQIEVADKTLELLEGPAPSKPRPHRRHLPPTPGHPILPSPPPKPQRVYTNPDEGLPPAIPPREPAMSKKDSLKEELKEWCQLELPGSEHDLLEHVKDPDQLANLASSYLTRHINVHTDIAMTADVADKIAKMLQEVAVHRKEILRKFLTDVIADTSSDPQTSMGGLSGIRTPSPLGSPSAGTQHSTVTSLLVEILRQFLDPQYLVLLCLQLLRALSHVPHNVSTMVSGQTISAVLGSMAVFRDDEEVQNFCLDILAKMATFVPSVLSKPPMRESSIELVVLAISLHDTSMTVVAAAVRVLANLAQSLHSLAFNSMIGSPTPDLRVYVSGVLDVLDYLYQQTCHRVRSALADSGPDLNIKMDGRRYLFEYGKMDQLKCQHQLWEVQPDSPVRPMPTYRDHQHHNSQDDLKSNDEYDDDNEDEIDSRNGKGGRKDAYGILKKSRSFENLRTPDRKVFFKSENGEEGDGDLTSSTSSSSSAGGSPNSNYIKNKNNDNDNRSNSPDIQVLSRSVICPSTLSPIPSLSGDETIHTSAISTNISSMNHHQLQQPYHSSPITTNNTPIKNSPATTPPTPNAPPVRRQIAAPLVHINSQSDSEAETTSGILESPSAQFHKNFDNKFTQEVSFNPDERYAEINDLDQCSDSSSGLISDYSVTSSCSSPSTSRRHHHHHSEETTKSLPFHSPISLQGFSYSAADVLYMKRVMSVQVTCHICSASIKGSVPPPLKLIDLPLCDLLQRRGIPKAISQFAHSQYDPKVTLMDIDPAIVIAIIDGVRYKMLAFELLQKTLLALLQRLSPLSVHQKITLVVGELLQSVSVDPSLSPIMENSDFVKQLHSELDGLRSNGLDPAITSHLWECLQPVASLTSKDDNLRKE